MISPETDDSGPDLDGAIRRLAAEFVGVFGEQTVSECVTDSHRRLGTMRIRSYEALLAYRFARQRLRAAAVGEGLLAKHSPEVLLVCTRNAGRSQLAAALLEKQAAGRVVVRSAGTDPATDLHPGVREALAEIGVDAGESFPKPLTTEFVAAADVVVTMGCGDACPVVPGRRYLDWDLADPEGASVDELRALRDDIAKRVAQLLDDLLGATA